MIYEYALTDTSEETVVQIERERKFPYHFYRPPFPRLETTRVGPKSDVSIGILLANRFIYEEALPILYKSVRFILSDLEGLLPLFYDTLSPFAKSCIRGIQLKIPEEHPSPFVTNRPVPSFHWAITCAQINSLDNPQLQVHIQGAWSVISQPENEKALLFPLCKLKAVKKFAPSTSSELLDYENAFQDLLSKAAKNLETHGKLREKHANMEIALMEDRIHRQKEKRVNHELKANTDFNLRAKEHCKIASRSMHKISPESNAQHDGRTGKGMISELSNTVGIGQLEWELKEQTSPIMSEEDSSSIFGEFSDTIDQDWDLDSSRNRPSTPTILKLSIETCNDTASTICARNVCEEEQGVNTDTEGWELVEK